MWEIINFYWDISKKSWFKKQLIPWYIPRWVISMRDEKIWREISSDRIQIEKDCVSNEIDRIIKERKKSRNQTAQIFNFPQR